MLHVAAMFIGMALLAALLAPDQLWMVFGAAVASVLASVWLGGVSRSPWRLPAMVSQFAMRFGATLQGAVAVARAALAADVSLKPALVRLRAPGDSNSLAALAGMISAVPGAIVVETDAEGFLIHVINEDKLNAEHLSAVIDRAKMRAEALR